MEGKTSEYKNIKKQIFLTFRLSVVTKNKKAIFLDPRLCFQQYHARQKWKYQLEENFGVYLHASNQIHPSLLSWDIKEILQQTCYFDKFEDAWPKPTKMTVSVCRKLRCLSSCKKSTSTFTSSLWLLWTCLSRHTKNYSITLSKTLMFSFIHRFFLTIL